MRHASLFLPENLLRHASQLSRISSLLAVNLPGELGKHVWFAGCEGGSAIMLTDSAAWVASLRFQQAQLLEALNAIPEVPTCTRMTVRVVPDGLPARR